MLTTPGPATYAARIRAARAYADLTQAELADGIGVTARTIKRRERGYGRPRRGDLLAIAVVCGVPEAFLINGFDPAKEQTS
jgi:transcriptional regulator with XRE-family HTH domain